MKDFNKMTLLKNAVILSLLTLVMTASLLATLVITLGEQVKTHHNDLNKPRMNTLIEQGVKP
jgi:hypothetical protein